MKVLSHYSKVWFALLLGFSGGIRGAEHVKYNDRRSDNLLSNQLSEDQLRCIASGIVQKTVNEVWLNGHIIPIHSRKAYDDVYLKGLSKRDLQSYFYLTQANDTPEMYLKIMQYVLNNGEVVPVCSNPQRFKIIAEMEPAKFGSENNDFIGYYMEKKGEEPKKTKKVLVVFSLKNMKLSVYKPTMLLEDISAAMKHNPVGECLSMYPT